MREDRAHRGRCAAAWGAAFIVAGSALAFADGPAAPRFGEVIDVPLVEVELLATDRDGRPVDDLSLAELSLFEDDKAVTPASFERLGGAAARTGAPGSGTASGTDRGAGADAEAPERYVAVFLDEVHVGPAGRRRLLTDLSKALAAELGPNDRVMVALYDGFTRVVLPFTRDRKALARALEDAESLSTARLMAERDRATVLELLYRDVSREAGNSPCLFAQAIVDNWLQQEYHRVDLAIGSFRAFVSSLAGIEGRKAVFHVSDGIPLRPGAEASEYAQELCSGFGVSQGQAGADFPLARDIYDPGSRTLEDTRYDTTRLWREVAARANAGNVTIYTIQAESGPDRFAASADHRVSGAMPETQSRAAANLQEPLFLVSTSTGGRALLGGGDLSAELRSAVAELHGQYLLTYRPPPRTDGDLRTIRVESRRPGVELRHRSVYRPLRLDDQIGSQLVGRILYGESTAQPASGVRLELGKVEAAGDDLVRVRFRLGVPVAGLGLTETEGGREGRFVAFLSVAGADGSTSGVRKAVVPVRFTGADAPQERFVWEVEIVLRPGKQRLGVAVYDEGAGTTSFLVRNFDLPEA